MMSQMRLFSSFLGVTLLATLVGCTSVNPYTGEQQASDATKVGIGGAATGAAVGALANGGEGALIGAGIGSVLGAAVGHSLDKENEALRQALLNTGVQVQKNGNQITLVMASDITFKVNSPDINAGFYPTLNSVAKVLKKYNNNNVIITGYTDNTGTPTYNQQLSQARAQSVGGYLVGQGVSSARIFTQGMGQLNPIASNNTNQGRAQNRRVEITLRPMSN